MYMYYYALLFWEYLDWNVGSGWFADIQCCVYENIYLNYTPLNHSKGGLTELTQYKIRHLFSHPIHTHNFSNMYICHRHWHPSSPFSWGHLSKPPTHGTGSLIIISDHYIYMYLLSDFPVTRPIHQWLSKMQSWLYKYARCPIACHFGCKFDFVTICLHRGPINFIKARCGELIVARVLIVARTYGVCVCVQVTAIFGLWVLLRASKGLYIEQSRFALKCLAQELWQYLLTLKTCFVHSWNDTYPERETGSLEIDSYSATQLLYSVH